MLHLSVIIPTYNADHDRLKRVLDGLRMQTLPKPFWQLVIVDNNSSIPVAAHIDLNWHPNAKVVQENQQGLTYARLKGFNETDAELLILVDDDNILDKHYLANALKIFNNYLPMGALGGKSLPLFETAPPAWLKDFYASLALRDRGALIETASWDNTYPACAPIGAGMCIRRAALKSYLQKLKSNSLIATDRMGSKLSSGGDNEIVLEILKSGWQVGYFPELQLQHIVPTARTQPAYLASLLRQTNQSWMTLLSAYKINPWPGIAPVSLPFRKLKAYFSYRAWKNQVNYINWQAACGMFDGLVKRYDTKG